MTKRPLVILHGWSGTSGSLKSLSSFLKKNGFRVVDIWLSDYLSMNDEITIQDLGQAMGDALRRNSIAQRRHSFDVIVHSTGGLVVRQYLVHYFYGRPEKCPIGNLVMLAPANFGSPWAHRGKSMAGRLVKGWKWNGLFETGTRILDALELGSSISWRIAKQDLFDSKNKIFKRENLYTTILIGTDAYTGFSRIAHKKGSDGTVYASTANLNAAYAKLTFKMPKGEDYEFQKAKCDPIAFGVLYNHNHASIINPQKDKTLADLLIKSLNIRDAGKYQDHVEDLETITKETSERGLKDPNEERSKRYHQYQHVVARVHDQFGDSIEDYFLEFFRWDGDPRYNVMQKIQEEILVKVHPYSRDTSYRSFLFDTTYMESEILKKDKNVNMSICAAAVSKRIRYHDPVDSITVVSKKEKILLRPNTTLLVDIELPRIQDKQVFKLKKA